MGSITRSFANNITTSGVLLPASLVNNSIANVTSYNAAVATGGMVLISSQTASNSASLSFTTGINSTYKEYQFWFIDIHARTDGSHFTWNASTDAGSNYNVTKTSTAFYAAHAENDSEALMEYAAASDLAQSTGEQRIMQALGSGADESGAGSLSLFNPASTTYVKHWINRNCQMLENNVVFDMNIAGYLNTTSAVNACRFKMSAGNFDGDILMYGIV